ncbi:MAG: hypothetical protein A2X18_10895 [Bacteroidetes bacterium GWF2_40_14]|nr:MAG: hypothetical protein A2X18_10895 [Bacteroidetes bacterium GWF2_40_14]
MATFRLELSNKPTRNRTFPIYLVVTIKGERKRIKTSIAVNRKSDFNSKARQNNWIRTTEPNAKAWNESLANEIETVRKEYSLQKALGQVSSLSIISDLKAYEKSGKNIKSMSFIQFAKERTRETLEAGHISTWKTYNGFCNKLEGYLASIGEKDINLEQITPSFLSKFHAYLTTLHNERQPDKVLHQNSIHLTLRIFKTFIKRIIDVEKLMKPEDNPFTLFRVNEVQTSRDKLEKSEIQKIRELELAPNSLIWHCRNYFLFSFYCAGIRIGDIMQLRWSNITNEGKLTYTMGKNHKERTLILVAQAQEILAHYHSESANSADYIFPILDNSASYAQAITQEEKDTMSLELKKKQFHKLGVSAALINKYLKQIAEKAGITKKISFHVARHSFAKAAKQEGIDNYVLKDMLNHSSLKTTEIYMKDFDTSSADKAMAQIFQQKVSPKLEIVELLDKMTPDEISMLMTKLKTNKPL